MLLHEVLLPGRLFNMILWRRQVSRRFRARFHKASTMLLALPRNRAVDHWDLVGLLVLESSFKFFRMRDFLRSYGSKF